MYIVTQDRMTIVNSDNVLRYYVYQLSNGCRIKAVGNGADAIMGFVLGEYKDKETAKKELDRLLVALIGKRDSYTMSADPEAWEDD